MELGILPKFGLEFSAKYYIRIIKSDEFKSKIYTNSYL